MRRLLALLLALTVAACAPVGTPADDDPQPIDESDGGVTEPPARQPAPTPTDGVVLRRGIDSLLLIIEGDVEPTAEVESPGDRVEVTLLDAQGALVEVHTAQALLYPIPGPWRRYAWWPTRAAADAAIVRLYRGEDVVLEVQLDTIDAVPPAGAHCDPLGFDDRCADGACFAEGAWMSPPGQAFEPRGAAVGSCAPIDPTAWVHDDVVLVDVRADDPEQGALALVGADTAEGFIAADLRPIHGASWRNFGFVRVTPPPALDLYVGPHLFATDLPVTPKPARAEGDACDARRLVDVCADGTACGPDDICRGISAPELEQVRAVVDPMGIVALTFEGRDAEGDVETLHVEVRDDEGQPMQRYDLRFDWSSRPNRFNPFAAEGHVIQQDGQLSGAYAVRDDRWPDRAASIRVALEDAEGLIGETLTVDLGAPPPPVERGVDGPCDPFGVLDRCPAGTFCDRSDGADGPMTCQRPPAACAEDLPRLDDTYSGDNSAAPDRTQASCTWSRGNIGGEQGHVFTAARAGRYRFTVRDAAPEIAPGYGLATLFVRRHCALPRLGDSERGCAHIEDEGQGPDSLTLEIALQADETVYVFVEAPWTGGAPYELVVEGP